MKLDTPIPIKHYRKRRAQLAKALGSGLVVLPTAPEHHRNADTHYDYRWDSGFFYLTGFREPEAVLVMLLGAKPRTILFCREKNLEREIWDGFRYGPQLARDMFGFDEAYPIAELDQRMPELSRTKTSCIPRSEPTPRGTCASPAGSMPCARRSAPASPRPRRSATCAPP
jgi:Xaa-Pro aminopeptidase